MNLIKFKHDSQHNLPLEFEKIDWRLRFIVMAWTAEVQLKFDYTPIITEIMRTQEEQDYIYTNLAPEDLKEKYKAEHFQSVHQYGRGIDLRSADMTQEMIDFTINYFKHIIYDIDRKIQTLVYHEVGDGIHFHIQINGHEPGMTCIRTIVL
jgi:hypothetical protein